MSVCAVHYFEATLFGAGMATCVWLLVGIWMGRLIPRAFEIVAGWFYRCL